ncbi:hypothetical protein FOZ61_003789 [Perkinsus olseni]|uniref:Uncharacterized protein n=1 Tax=Perkinsus olseni TaxID=32597 RepID=A0A7J6MDC7_PEROL|nr:hypothetical protein FOZ61_003789 [Perkinsus olseni]KAF4674998.1 hypothetical protein FOL46_003166 [Perkinsus olseni]
MPEGVGGRFDSPSFLQSRSTPPIQSVDELYAEVSELVTNITNVWSWGINTTTLYRIKLPYRARIRVKKAVSTSKPGPWNEEVPSHEQAH